MRVTPSYLKGLAETRARADGELKRHQKLLSEIERKLKVAKADVERYQHMQVQVAQQLVVAQTDLDACDRLIRKCDARINPEEIEPISAWKGRYGKRGALKASIASRTEPLMDNLG